MMYILIESGFYLRKIKKRNYLIPGEVKVRREPVLVKD